MEVPRFCFLLCLLPLSQPARDPLPEDRGAAGRWQSLKRLQTTARVMYLTAHPDDEDGGMMTLLSRGQGVDVTLAVLTRGEAGANLIAGDFFDSRGALRTAELLRAADYSKNLEETFQNWDREAVLSDLVGLIRMEKPHVWGGASWRRAGAPLRRIPLPDIGISTARASRSGARLVSRTNPQVSSGHLRGPVRTECYTGGQVFGCTGEPPAFFRATFSARLFPAR